jgi:GT2 family glycosyltransferase
MTTGKKKKVSICTVTYNSAKDIERFLRSCETCLPAYDIELIVVDNSSSDETVSLILGVEGSLLKSVVRKERNVFYTKAINEAISLAAGEYILVVNPDCYFDVGMLDALVGALKDDAGVCGPSFFYPDGREQHSGTMFPGRRAFLELARGRVERFFRVTPGVRGNGVRYYDVLYGACWLIRRDFQRQVGLLDEQLVHGWDEYDYFMRVNALGKRCAEVSGAKCFHVRGASRTASLEPELHKYYVGGLMHLSRKYYGRLFGKLMALCLRH